MLSLGTFGNTYPIREPDALVELKQEIKKVDVEKLRKELETKFRNYKPSDWHNLTPATKPYSYYVDMTYTLDTDIPQVNDQGEITGILYPKGFRFNPLEYMPADPPPLIIFNGENKKEKEWVKYYYKNQFNVMFLITKGNFAKLSEEIGRPVYYLKDLIAEKLQLRNTVSIVYREKNNMRVDVYAIANAKEKKK
jgi:conjugal transfer pilus assembly protein TraW